MRQNKAINDGLFPHFATREGKRGETDWGNEQIKKRK